MNKLPPLLLVRKSMSNQKLYINNYLNQVGIDFYPNLSGKPRDDLAFEILSIAIILNKPFQEVWDNIIIRDRINGKSGGDAGIDGVYFDLDDEICEMSVFQCKNKEDLSPKEIEKFKNDVRDIFIEGRPDSKLNVQFLKPAIEEFNDLTQKRIFIDVKQYFLFNGTTKVSGNEDVYKKFNDPDNNFQILDENDLYARISNLANRKRKEVKFKFNPLSSGIATVGDPQSLYTFYAQNIKAANFRISAGELCSLMDKEVSVNGTTKTLFQENIRDFLRMKSKANKNINETLHKPDESWLFPFLNNGITIICELLTIGERQVNQYLIEVTNPQIVNGLQTSMVIYQNYASNKSEIDFLKNVSVNIRVYQVTEKSIIEKITDATNTQAPINFRDKVSTREFNTKTEQLFASAGITYIAKRDAGFTAKNKKKQTVESETVMKFWYATFHERPDISKNSISKVTQEIYEASTDNTHELSYLFKGDNDSPIYGQFLAAYRIYSFVHSKKMERQMTLDFIGHADELLSYAIYKDLGDNLAAYNDSANLIEPYERGVEIINNIVVVERALKRNFSYNSYFKIPKCKSDFDNRKIKMSTTIVHKQGELFQ